MGIQPEFTYLPLPYQIYDPYFCAGAVKRNLGHLGFKAVRNENEDCYKAQARASWGRRSACPVPWSFRAIID